MKIINKIQFTSLFVTLLLTVAPITAMAAQPTVNLGTTKTFAVLAGSTITNTGSTTINGEVGGNVGLASGRAFTGRASMTIGGAVHVADTTAVKAKDDLVTAYNDASSRKPVTRIPSELGNTTLKPGVYDSADGTFQITGKLTLDAKGDPNGVFVFKTNSTLKTAPNSTINLKNGARFCRTFWKVGSSATLEVNSHFVGHIFALDSITANKGATVQGQILARNGSVTLDNNVITNGFCNPTKDVPSNVATSKVATLNTVKIINNGEKSSLKNFNMFVKNLNTGVTASPSSKDINSYILTGGTYRISTAPISGYTISYKGLDSDNVVTISPGETKTVTIIANSSSKSTVVGGQLPKTASNLYEILLIGAALTMVGVLGWRKRKIE